MAKEERKRKCQDVHVTKENATNTENTASQNKSSFENKHESESAT